MLDAFELKAVAYNMQAIVHQRILNADRKLRHINDRRESNVLQLDLVHAMDGNSTRHAANM